MPQVEVDGGEKSIVVSFPAGMPYSEIKRVLREKFAPVKEFISNAYEDMSGLERAAIGTSFVPMLGDVVGLAADAEMYIKDPESRTLVNGLLSAAGLLPFVPNVASISKLANRLDIDLSTAKAEGYNVDDLYTHAGGEITSIEKGGEHGIFDGVFASPGGESLHGYQADAQTTFILKRPAAGPGEVDLDYDAAMGTLRKEYPDASDGQLDSIYEMAGRDENVFAFDENPLADFGFDDLGEASWEGQRLRGRIAADQNFDAIAMDDEHGISYLIPAGSSARVIGRK